MYAVSEEYRKAMHGKVQTFRLTGTAGNRPFTEANILKGSFSVTNQCSGSDAVEIGMLSPVTVYQTLADKKTDYAAPDEERFYELLRQNARSKWALISDQPFPEDFSVTPLSVTQKDKVVTSFKGTRITAWMGSYYLTGPQTLLDLLYQIGLGAKSSQGFGMFQVL